MKHVVPFHPIIVQTPREDWHQLGLDITGGEIVPVKSLSSRGILRKIWRQYVHAQGRGSPFPEMCSLFAKKSVYTPHSDTIGRKGWVRPLRRFVFNRYDKVVCQSEYGRRNFIKEGIRADKIVVLPIPVDYEFFSKTSGGDAFRKKHGLGRAPFAVAVGIRPVKNPDVIINACKAAGMKVVMIGPRDLDEAKSAWKDEERVDWYLPASIGQDSDVILTGQLSAKELRAAFDAATVFVNSSDYECFGLAIHEAAAAGLPLCIPNYGSLEKFKDCALFHDCKDAKALAENLQIYLKDKKLRELHGKRAQEIAKQHDYKVVRKRFEAFYREFLGERFGRV